MTHFAVLDVDLLAYRALIVVMKDVSVSLSNGVPGRSLRHHTA